MEVEVNVIYLIIAGFSAAITSLATVIGATFKVLGWLTKKFDSMRDIADKRHEDNIQRFSVIETKLNTIIKNGH